MPRKLITYDQAGQVKSITHFTKNKDTDEKLASTLERLKLKYSMPNLNSIIIEGDIDKSGLDHVGQMYVEDGVLHRDENWERCLMNPDDIANREIKRLEKEIKDNINSNSPDLLLAKLDEYLIKDIQEDMKKFYKTKDRVIAHKYYQKGLEGIQRRVAAGEADKPLIREKLINKLNESE